MVDKREIKELTARQRIALCDLLDGLTIEQFNTDSLAAGWRVRDVIGHLVSIVELPMWRFAALTLKGLDRAFDKYAKQFGERDPYELVNAYRSRADKFLPVNPAGKFDALIDVATHSLDISVPLGLDAVVLDDAKPLILGALTDRSWATALGMKLFRGRSTSHLRLIATDVSWSHGDGPEVSGTADDLILAITGRAVGGANFDGPGTGVLLSGSS